MEFFDLEGLIEFSLRWVVLYLWLFDSLELNVLCLLGFSNILGFVF